MKIPAGWPKVEAFDIFRYRGDGLAEPSSYMILSNLAINFEPHRLLSLALLFCSFHTVAG